MRDWNSITYDRYISDNKLGTSVGHGILDISRDIDSELIRKRSFDMTFWMINQSLKNGFGSYRGYYDKVEDILEASLTAGDSICIVQCQGMMSVRLSHIITLSIEYFNSNPSRFVMGHIMAREGRYPGLHRQMLVINLKVWEQLGKPPYLEQGFFWDRKPVYKNFQVSESKINADYTPEWIAPSDGETEFSSTEDGANWVDISLRNGLPIDNFNLEMRECKVFVYPYEDTKQLEKVWNNLQQEEEVDKLTNYGAKAWIRKLAYQEYIEKNRVYAFNTERLSAEGVRSPGPIDALFSAAAGFKPLALLRNNQFHDKTVVHYFDWCESSLNFKKHLLESWDGVDFHKWLLEHDLKYNFSSTYRRNYEEFWEMEVNNEFESKEKFKELWDRYRQLEHHFHVIDIVTESEKLFQVINQYQGNKVLWTTNIWASMQLHWAVEPEQLEQYWLKFQNLIPEDLVLYGQDYMARDMNGRVRNSKVVSHHRYYSNNKYVKSEKTLP
jgi:hypothetical protein